LPRYAVALTPSFAPMASIDRPSWGSLIAFSIRAASITTDFGADFAGTSTFYLNAYVQQK
jgi:hypothetical protein